MAASWSRLLSDAMSRRGGVAPAESPGLPAAAGVDAALAGLFLLTLLTVPNDSRSTAATVLTTDPGEQPGGLAGATARSKPEP